MWSIWQTCRTGRRAAGFLGGLLVALLLAAGPVTGQSLPSLPNQATLSNGGVATSPVVAAGLTISEEVQVYFAWKEGQDIYLKRALARPGSCGSPGRLEFDPAGTRQLSSFNSTLLSISSPAIAANARGEVFVAWVETPNTSGLQQYIRLSRALEGGAPSLHPVDFVNFNSKFPNARPNNPAVAADGSGLFVAAEGSVSTGVPGMTRTAVLLARSLDGQPFDYVNLTAKVLDVPVVAPTRRPSIASDGSKVHVVYRNGGVWYRGFERGSTQDEVNRLGATALTSASVQFPPKVAVYGRDSTGAARVTAAWIEGTSLMAHTTTGGSFLGSAGLIHSAPMRLSNLSLTVGPAGRLFGWQQATGTSTSENRFRLEVEGATAQTYESDSFFELDAVTPVSGPSVAQDGTGRIMASWRDRPPIGTTPAQIMRGYTGGSGGEDAPVLDVRHAPQTLNAKTMDQGNGVFNFWISGVQGEIYLNSVKVNGKRIPLIRSAVDANGDLQLTFYRTALKDAFVGDGLTAAQLNGSYIITADTSTGCFQTNPNSRVQIIR